MKHRVLEKLVTTVRTQVVRTRYLVDAGPPHRPTRVVDVVGEEVTAVRPALAKCGARVIQLPVGRRKVSA